MFYSTVGQQLTEYFKKTTEEDLNVPNGKKW
jgi:hypothetical protein